MTICKRGIAFYIGRNTLITSASNLYSERTQCEATKVLFYPSFELHFNQSAPKCLHVKSFKFNESYKFTSNQEKYINNYAVLILEENT